MKKFCVLSFILALEHSGKISTANIKSKIKKNNKKNKFEFPSFDYTTPDFKLAMPVTLETEKDSQMENDIHKADQEAPIDLTKPFAENTQFFPGEKKFEDEFILYKHSPFTDINTLLKKDTPLHLKTVVSNEATKLMDAPEGFGSAENQQFPKLEKPDILVEEDHKKNDSYLTQYERMDMLYNNPIHDEIVSKKNKSIGDIVESPGCRDQIKQTNHILRQGYYKKDGLIVPEKNTLLQDRDKTNSIKK